MNDDHDDDGDGYGVCLQIREEWDRERGELVDGSSRKRFGEGPADISERERERDWWSSCLWLHGVPLVSPFSFLLFLHSQGNHRIYTWIIYIIG